jgi:hypothetical protein
VLDGGELSHVKYFLTDLDGKGAVLGDFDEIRIVDDDPDLRRIVLRRDDELISNLSAAAVEDQIESRVELFVSDQRKRRNFLLLVRPGRVHVPDKFVQSSESFGFGFLMRARKSNHERSISEENFNFSALEMQLIRRRFCQEADARRRLFPILLEDERQILGPGVYEYEDDDSRECGAQISAKRES